MNFADLSTCLGAVGFVLTLFSCLRLAKFNLDDRQADTFIGLNTPSCTTFILGLTLCAHQDIYHMREVILQMPLLLGIVGVFSYLLVSEIPMFSFKFKNLSWAANKYRFALIIFVVGVFAGLELGAALMLVVLTYIFFSLVLWGMGILSVPKRNPAP